MIDNKNTNKAPTKIILFPGSYLINARAVFFNSFSFFVRCQTYRNLLSQSLFRVLKVLLTTKRVWQWTSEHIQHNKFMKSEESLGSDSTGRLQS